MKWWQKTIIYECYPKSFKDTKGQGTGTIAGIIEKLDYITSLGVGGIWLTPVFVSPMKDNGYDVADYENIDPSFGSMLDMKELMKEAKKRNIRIILDLVFNHTSDQNAWFLTSRKDRTNGKADWYIWRDPDADGSAPTNWRSIFGGSAWTWCEERQQYYLHTFAPSQPDLNWANPQVRKKMQEITQFWINAGAGGFRVDAITYIRKPDVFADGPVDGADGLSSIHPLTANQPGILDYLNEYRNGLPDKGPDGDDLFWVGEANGVSSEELTDWVGEGKPFDMLFEFSHIDLPFRHGEIWCRPDSFTFGDLVHAIDSSEVHTKDSGWYPVFFENHDQPRSVDHFFPGCKDKDGAARLLAVLLETLRGTPFIYQGEELGTSNVQWPYIDDYNDVSSHGQYAFALKEGFTEEQAISFVQRFSRDNARTPMPWNHEKNAGFTEGKPWLKLNDSYTAVNAEDEEKDEHSLLNWYRKLASLRKKHPALSEGTYRRIDAQNDNLFIYQRETNNETITVIANGSENDEVIDADLLKEGKLLLSSKEIESNKLKPYQALLVKN